MGQEGEARTIHIERKGDAIAVRCRVIGTAILRQSIERGTGEGQPAIGLRAIAHATGKLVQEREAGAIRLERKHGAW